LLFGRGPEKEQSVEKKKKDFELWRRNEKRKKNTGLGWINLDRR